MNKVSVELSMAIETPVAIREESLDLNVGYDEKLQEWELILRYTGNLDDIREELNIEIEELLGGYGITNITENKIPLLIQYPQIDYIEKPKSLFLQEMEGIQSSCVTRLRLPEYNLTGTNVIVACIDSGVDVFHPDFRKADGSTRILYLWDQTIEGKPPQGYHIGTEYTEEEINQYLFDGMNFPSYDTSGHGTAVLGVMAANGNASNQTIEGMAPEADIIVVKLSNASQMGFPRTTQLMLGVDYSVKKAIALQKPIAVNISFGNNYGDHLGGSIVERYFDAVTRLYQLNIVAGSGNEGLSARHVSGVLEVRPYVYQEEIKEFVVERYLVSFNMQIWKEYGDEFDLYMELPAGQRIGPFSSYSAIQNYIVGTNRISVYYGSPTPYNRRQEIYVSVTSSADYVSEGIWKLILVPKTIIDGRYNVWLPMAGSTTADIYFLQPSLSNTIVIPATATGLITVSAYDSRNGTYAAFSGRGSQFYTGMEKPDLCAPGVNINTCAVGGGYTVVTGTSFASPFVAGACALLMEYGIVNGNDPYLYGERMRAVLRQSAIPLPFQQQIPDELAGFGRLCVGNAI